jgi:hypothetical protein
MTIKTEKVILWDSGIESFCAVAVPEYEQYRYVDGKPCITIGFAYENPNFKGYDVLTFFDDMYIELLGKIQSVYETLEGSFVLDDMGGDTDSCIEVRAEKTGKIYLNGQLGASWNTYTMQFAMTADQTLLKNLIDCIK